jgi:hemoglobin
MAANPEAAVFATIGEEGFERLTAAFYRRVAGDDILRAMYPSGDLEPARERLRDFLIFRFGGPARYIERRGHPKLRARHMPFEVDAKARDRWVLLMNAALEEARLPAEAAGILRHFFATTATFLINRGGAAGRGGICRGRTVSGAGMIGGGKRGRGREWRRLQLRVYSVV